jgi:competence ComEA-like helix-hairpin-helix protein
MAFFEMNTSANLDYSFMGNNNWIKEYFSFTRKERIGISVLVFLLLIVLLIPAIPIFRTNMQPAATDSSWITAISSLETNHFDKDTIGQNIDEKPVSSYAFELSLPGEQQPVLFAFNPNTLSEAGWQKLGLKEKTIQTIQHYLAKGGHFYKREDLKKIYGLNAADYARLYPFINIPDSKTERRAQTAIENESVYSKKIAELTPIDINTADTAAFMKLPGIGSVLARRIVKFREKLGGFYSIGQIKETYGLKDSVFQKLLPYLKLESALIKMIHINTATKEELQSHPYISWNIANAIIEYRNQHGNYTQAAELKNIALIDEVVYQKIRPYITVN